jgi:hypothetical protein
MSDTNQPENVIPLNPESSHAEQTQQPVSDASSTPAAEQTDLPPPSEENTIDLDKVTHEEVIQRLIEVTKRLTYELLLSLKLHEHIALRDNPEAAAAAKAEADATGEEKV